MSDSFYESLSALYDVMIDWPKRLASEGPALETWLRARGARRVLDVACGTGRHAAYLAEQGFDAVGADRDPAMVAEARKHSAVPFHAWPMDAESLPAIEPVDAILCLGNSFPHLLHDEDALRALANFRALLNPGGAVLLQMKNLQRRVDQEDLSLPPLERLHEGRSLRFVRLYDRAAERPDLLAFHLLTLDEASERILREETTWLRIYTHLRLDALCREAGFGEIDLASSLSGDAFDPGRSEDVVVTAFR